MGDPNQYARSRQALSLPPRLHRRSPCGGKCLRGEDFCYFHHGTRKPAFHRHQNAAPDRKAAFDLPVFEDRSSILAGIHAIAQRLAANQLDTRRAGLLLYAAQIALQTQPRPLPAEPPFLSDIADEVILDPALGPVAPVAEFEIAEEDKTLEQILMEGWEKSEEDAIQDRIEVGPPPRRRRPCRKPPHPRRHQDHPGHRRTRASKIRRCSVASSASHSCSHLLSSPSPETSRPSRSSATPFTTAQPTPRSSTTWPKSSGGCSTPIAAPTSPRADPKDVAWVHGTRIGIAISSDGGAHWTYKGTAEIPYGKPDYTHWAPDIVRSGSTYHMFLTIVPGTFHDWNASREIIHLTSPDLEHWTFVSKLTLDSERVIDPSLYQLPDKAVAALVQGRARPQPHPLRRLTRPQHLEGHGPGHHRPQQRRPENLPLPRSVLDADRHVEGHRASTTRTMRSQWKPQPAKLLDTPGKLPTDRSYGHHVDVVVHGDRAFLFYFTHQLGDDLDPRLPHSEDRTVLQVTELQYKDGMLTADRDQPTHVSLGP